MCSLCHLSWDVVPRHPMKNCTLRKRSHLGSFLASLQCSNVKGGLQDNQGQDNRSGSLPSGGKSQADILYSTSGRRDCGVFSIYFPSLLCPVWTAQPNQHFEAMEELCWGKPLNFLFPRPTKATNPKVRAGWVTWFLQIKQLFCYIWGACGEKQPFTL